MKFAHISDTHLGQYRSIKEREEDSYNAFRQTIEKSIEEKVDFVIFSGDIFDRSNPPNDAVLLMMQQLMLLKEKGIQSYFILGDHDQPKVEQNPIHWLYKMTGFAHHLDYQEDGPTKLNDVLLIGFDHRSAGKDTEELMEKFNEIDLIAKEHVGHKILVLHQPLTEVHYHAAKDSGLSANDLPKNFTYYAIGDIHKNYEKKYEFLGGPLIYPGSIEISSTEPIKESSKGFYIVDISSEEAIPKWIELDLRPRFEIETDAKELHNVIVELISKIDNTQKPLVSLNIKYHDWDEIKSEIGLLKEHVLDYSINMQKDEKQYPLSLNESGNIDEEFRRLATKNVGEELAMLAFEKIYPALNENKQEIKQVIIKNFEDYKKGKQV